MTKPLCIYHGDCVDGFTAAWAVHRFFNGEVDFHAGYYGEIMPGVVGRQVLIVDFSYPADTLKLMSSLAKGVLVLDHHKTAEEALKEFPAPDGPGELPTSGIKVLFDMKRSGAGIAWDYLFHRGYAMRPEIINYVEDRDLWKFSKENSRLVYAAMASYPFDFRVYDRLSTQLETVVGRNDLMKEGLAIDRRHLQICGDLIKTGKRMMVIGGVEVPVVNAPFQYASDIGNTLARDLPDSFAATYYDRSDGRRVYSLRSVGDAIDVSEIAKVYGGGGHKNAAGFTMNPEELVYKDRP